jgi:5-methylcytosine-specific restriction protein B
LHEFTTQEEVEEEIRENGFDAKVVNQFIDLIFNIKKGHIIIAYSAPSTIYGIGIVNEDDWIYNYNEEYYLVNSRKVKWADDFQPKKLDNKKPYEKNLIDILKQRSTLFEIENDDFPKLIEPLIPKGSIVWTWIKSEKLTDLTNLDLLNKKKQIIFYGPPGTGKTYKTREYAISLIKKHITEE